MVCGTYAPTVARGVTLTVEPGVVVQFEPNGGLTVAGTIFARGTVGQPITFTGVVQSPGSWQGLTIEGSPTARNTGSVLSYVTVEYGGTTSANAANLTLWYAQASILHGTFRYGARHGLHAIGNDALANISDSSFLTTGQPTAAMQCCSRTAVSSQRWSACLPLATAWTPLAWAVTPTWKVRISGRRWASPMSLPAALRSGRMRR